MLDLTAASSPDDFGNELTDFSALDEAFGGPSIPAPKPQEPVAEAAPGATEGARRGDEDQEKRVDLCELKVQMNALEGPRKLLSRLSLSSSSPRSPYRSHDSTASSRSHLRPHGHRQLESIGRSHTSRMAGGCRASSFRLDGFPDERRPSPTRRQRLRRVLLPGLGSLHAANVAAYLQLPTMRHFQTRAWSLGRSPTSRCSSPKPSAGSRARRAMQLAVLKNGCALFSTPHYRQLADLLPIVDRKTRSLDIVRGSRSLCPSSGGSCFRQLWSRRDDAGQGWLTLYEDAVVELVGSYTFLGALS